MCMKHFTHFYLFCVLVCSLFTINVSASGGVHCIGQDNLELKLTLPTRFKVVTRETMDEIPQELADTGVTKDYFLQELSDGQVEDFLWSYDLEANYEIWVTIIKNPFVEIITIDKLDKDNSPTLFAKFIEKFKQAAGLTHVDTAIYQSKKNKYMKFHYKGPLPDDLTLYGTGFCTFIGQYVVSVHFKSLLKESISENEQVFEKIVDSFTFTFTEDLKKKNSESTSKKTYCIGNNQVKMNVPLSNKFTVLTQDDMDVEVPEYLKSYGATKESLSHELRMDKNIYLRAYCKDYVITISMDDSSYDEDFSDYSDQEILKEIKNGIKETGIIVQESQMYHHSQIKFYLIDGYVKAGSNNKVYLYGGGTCLNKKYVHVHFFPLPLVNKEFTLEQKKELREIIDAIRFDELPMLDNSKKHKKIPTFCYKCGSKIIPGGNFCSRCGTKVVVED